MSSSQVISSVVRETSSSSSQSTMPSSSSSMVQSKTKKKTDSNNSKKVRFAALECKYSVITNVAKQIGWKLVQDDKKDAATNIFWIDVATIHERFRSIQPWQMINHFPGMPNIARKNRMGHHLNKMLKLFPKEYAFYPRTWVLPGEMHDFRSQFDNNGNSIGNKIYIIKPDAGCQGRGIFLTRTLDKVPVDENVVAQLYIQKPLLLDGYKFDLRLYCVVTSVKPLRMYLMQDGLVRMCTEEYVKPTQKNLDNVCMHLTNYAVNKHNENFQQSSAQTSEECQDEGSKRSLLWFMNFVRETRGDRKADWLWKRMGQLCVQTVLSILPTLSREYDQHFKSFNNVPNKPAADIFASKQRHTQKKEKNDDDDDDDDDEDDDDEDEEDDDSKDEGTDAKTDNEEKGDKGIDADAATGSEKAKPKKPMYRGSRCFEILGFDIMIDAYLKPWLIEVNHLPSFGTDSALDLDIKNRLMQQVLSAIPVRADDEAAYILHHKVEAEKRLTKDNKRNRIEKIEEKPVARPKRVEPVSRKEPVQDNSSNNSSSNSSNNNNTDKHEHGSNESVADESTANVPDSSYFNQDHLPSLGSEPSRTETQNGECTPERLEEIKAILMAIYNECRPDKVNKIERLLERYQFREEQFLSFVYEKYGITPPQKEPPKPAVRQAPPSLAPRPPVEVKEKPRVDLSKRVSRSLSPPPTQKRPVASWKGISDEDAASLRAEALELHVPKDNDFWIEKELKCLTQFTQIFPPEPLKDTHNKDNTTADKEEDEREDNDGEENEETETDTTKSSAPVKKRASYDDIIFQVFLEDRRQMMRFRNPLIARAHDRPSSEPRGKDGSVLPPLDNRNRIGASGKGPGLGKAPPKDEKNGMEKVPTKVQMEAVNRLYQGLSSRSSNKDASAQLMNREALDAQSVVQYSNMSISPKQQSSYLLHYGGDESVYAGASLVFQTKTARMMEQSKKLRMQLEVQRAPPESILLRQQVFAFDQHRAAHDPTRSNLENPLFSASSFVSSSDGTNKISHDLQYLNIARSGNKVMRSKYF